MKYQWCFNCAHRLLFQSQVWYFAIRRSILGAVFTDRCIYHSWGCGGILSAFITWWRYIMFNSTGPCNDVPETFFSCIRCRSWSVDQHSHLNNPIVTRIDSLWYTFHYSDILTGFARLCVCRDMYDKCTLMRLGGIQYLKSALTSLAFGGRSQTWRAGTHSIPLLCIRYLEHFICDLCKLHGE